MTSAEQCEKVSVEASGSGPALAAGVTPNAETVAQWFHEAYERLAPSYGYETRRASAVPWSDVPEPNRSLMVAVAGKVLAQLDSSGAPTDGSAS